jgi:hypothetical protein
MQTFKEKPYRSFERQKYKYKDKIKTDLFGR